MKRSRHYRRGFSFASLLDPARSLRRSETLAETLLWQLLRNRQMLGFKFRRQHRFGNCVFDFYCPEALLGIECDGSIHETNQQWHHDRCRDAQMAGEGIRVLRFSNKQILYGTENVSGEIAQHLPSPSGRGAGGEGLARAIKPSPRPSPKGRGR